MTLPFPQLICPKLYAHAFECTTPPALFLEISAARFSLFRDCSCDFDDDISRRRVELREQAVDLATRHRVDIHSLRNDVQLLSSYIPGALGHIQDSRLRALAVTGTTRMPQLPDLPTMAEAGVPGYTSGTRLSKRPQPT